MMRDLTLKEMVTQQIEAYFKALEGQPPQNLHAIVMKEVEHGLFNTVLQKAGGNQSKAAQWLGIARGTLRQRLAELGIDYA